MAKEDWAVFHKKFITDSVFQMSRIVFPLQGINTEAVFDAASETDRDEKNYLIKNKKYYWKQDGWEIQGEFVNQRLHNAS